MKALLGVFDIVPGWMYALALAGLALLFHVQHIELLSERADHALTKSEFSGYEKQVFKRESLRAQAALIEQEKQRDLERIRRAAASAADSLLAAEARRSAESRAAYEQRGGLLDAAIARITAAGSAGGERSGDSPALRRAETAATTLGDLLATCRREAGEDAGELEGLASQVRGLILQYEGLLKKAPSPLSMLPMLPSTSDTWAPEGASLLRSTTVPASPPATAGSPAG
jgi:hypothetical protein